MEASIFNFQHIDSLTLAFWHLADDSCDQECQADVIKVKQKVMNIPRFC